MLRKMLHHRFRTLSGLIVFTLLAVATIAQGIPHFNALAWTASTTAGVTSYKVYRATVSGGPYTLIGTTANGTTTTFQDNNTTQGVTHYYVVTALVGTNESVFTTQVSAIDAGTNVNPPTGLTVMGQ